MESTSYQLRLPARFVDDHYDRIDWPASVRFEIIRRVSKDREVIVEVDRIDLAELLSDADHYAESIRDMDSDFRGLCLSAKATAARIRKAVSAEALAEALAAYRAHSAARRAAIEKEMRG